jgi:hypothetical protein
MQMLSLTCDDLARIEHRAHRWSRSIGTVQHELARDIFRLLEERQQLLIKLACKDDEPERQA